MKSKVLLVCANGGHLTEMKYVHSRLDFSNNKVVWISYSGSDTNNLHGYFSPDFHNRFMKLFFSGIIAAWVFCWIRPKKVLATADIISLPYALLCRILGIQFIYFDCATRVRRVSGTARLIHGLGHEILVQHKMLEGTLPRARYLGGLI